MLGSSSFAGRPREALVLVAAVAFLLIGPYSYLAGAISLDFGGKRGGATACGIIDGVGYLFGGVLAGKVIASLSVAIGWQGRLRDAVRRRGGHRDGRRVLPGQPGPIAESAPNRSRLEVEEGVA